jgi:hypothetical protein
MITFDNNVLACGYDGDHMPLDSTEPHEKPQ